MGATSETKDVFISYRRNGGATVARLLCDVLNQRNISTFFDKENLGEGDFDNAIEKNLHAARNFILIVSPKLFDRGRDANGQYDAKATESDWVYREIRIALESGKPIIPIFVDGEQGFPALLPMGIEGISRKDALTLGHDHFESELQKLISRIKTNKDQLIETYIKKLSSLPPREQCETIIGVCQEIGGESATLEITKLASNKLRQLIINNKNSSLAIKAIVDTTSTGLIKEICKELNIDNTGGSTKIKTNLTNWINNNKFETFSIENHDSDRFKEFVEIFGRYFKSPHHKKTAIEIANEEDINLETIRSSHHIYKSIFDMLTIDEFFTSQSRKFSEDDIKGIAFNLLGNDKGRKNELIQLIVDYVNYEYTPEELD